MSWPLIGCTACVHFVVVVIFGALFGRYLLRLLSIVPFLLDKFFRAVYIIIEYPIDLLHRKYGGCFCDIENFVAEAGRKIDGLMLGWYGSWRHVSGVGSLDAPLPPVGRRTCDARRS